jgi:hypothetical protein
MVSDIRIFIYLLRCSEAPLVSMSFSIVVAACFCYIYRKDGTP